MNDKVTYRQQVSFCGKQSCRKCRDGVGHGPYWYAYRLTADGRKERVYIGKHLPPEATTRQGDREGREVRPNDTAETPTDPVQGTGDPRGRPGPHDPRGRPGPHPRPGLPGTGTVSENAADQYSEID